MMKQMKFEIGIKHWYLPLCLLTVGMLFSYESVIGPLVQQWLNNEDFSHGLLIVPISLYLCWEKRSQLMAADIRADWRALPVLILAVVIFIIGELGAELFTTRVSMIVFLIGAIWLVYGIAVVRILKFPLLFLFLMLPLPGFIYRNMTFPLQLLSSVWSVKLLHLLGITAFREGNVIDMGFTQFQVVEACNGLRFILPLFTLGVLFAYFGKKALWKRVLLVISTVPIAIMANVFRIAGTGVVSLYWGTEAAEGFFHLFSGWAVFMVCFVLFAAFNLFLSRLPERRKAKTPEDEEAPEDGKGGPVHDGGSRPRRFSLSYVPLILAVGLAFATPALVDALADLPPKTLKQPLSAFPKDFLGWKGEAGKIDAEIWEQVGGQQYVMLDYRKPELYPINFYVAYYEYQKKAGDFIHSPKLCLPGAGWFIEQSRVRNLHDGNGGSAPGSGHSLKFNEIVMSKNEVRQLAYYWYQGRDRNFTSEYTAKFLMVWDGIWRRRTDGALVRLVMPMRPDQSIKEARSILDPFALTTSYELNRYLP